MTAADTPQPAPIVACAERAASQEYLESVRTEVYAHWPGEARGTRDEVRVGFKIDAQGNLRSTEVRSSSSEAAAREMTAALEAAAPFPAMPPEASCLANERLLATFKRDAALTNTPPESIDPQVTRAHWIARLAIATTLLIGARRVWQQIASPGRVETGPRAGSAPGREHAFHYSGLRQLAVVLGMAHLIPVFVHTPVLIALLLVADLALATQFLFARRVPLLRVSPAEVGVHASPFHFPRKLMTTELASYFVNRSALVMQSARGERLDVPLGALSQDDREALLLLVSTLPLAAPQVSLADIPALHRSSQLRNALILGVALAGALVATEMLLWPRE